MDNKPLSDESYNKFIEEVENKNYGNLDILYEEACERNDKAIITYCNEIYNSLIKEVKKDKFVKFDIVYDEVCKRNDKNTIVYLEG